MMINETLFLSQKQEVKLMKLLIFMGLNQEETMSVAALLQRKTHTLEFLDRVSAMNYEMTFQQILRTALEINLGHPI